MNCRFENNVFCFGEQAQAFKRKTDRTCQTELQTLVLPRTSNLTELYHSGDDGPTKCVRLFRSFYRLRSKFLSKLDNREYC